MFHVLTAARAAGSGGGAVQLFQARNNRYAAPIHLIARSASGCAAITAPSPTVARKTWQTTPSPTPKPASAPARGPPCTPQALAKNTSWPGAKFRTSPPVTKASSCAAGMLPSVSQITCQFPRCGTPSAIA